ncbi:MAG: hypothetical protein F4Y49_13050 [Dehalococcoidia bacterium]|nr:hypothetical protein [Dehalococcoidia bacterium]
MRGILITLAGVMILSIGVACGTADEENAPAAAQVADLSQFPTPTRSQAQPRPTPPSPAAQSRPSTNEVSGTEEAPMTQEEIQQLRQQMQSGQLSEEEAQRAIQRLRAQFGGGQGGPFGGDAGSVAFGPIESVTEDTITVKTELASVTASVGEDTNIRITSLLDHTALTAGAQVRVVSERAEGSTLARVITIIPEGQDAFGGRQGGQGGFGAGQGIFGGGQGGLGTGQGAVGPRALSGTVEDVTDTGFLLETQQGPLPVDMDDESVVIQTHQGTIDDLEIGMLVRVLGPADEDGRIDARTVAATPEGLEDFPGFGGGNRGGARGLGGGN